MMGLPWVQVGRLSGFEVQRLLELYEVEALAHSKLAHALDECGREGDAEVAHQIAVQCALAAATLRERVES